MTSENWCTRVDASPVRELFEDQGWDEKEMKRLLGLFSRFPLRKTDGTILLIIGSASQIFADICHKTFKLSRTPICGSLVLKYEHILHHFHSYNDFTSYAAGEAAVDNEGYLVDGGPVLLFTESENWALPVPKERVEIIKFPAKPSKFDERVLNLSKEVSSATTLILPLAKIVTAYLRTKPDIAKPDTSLCRASCRVSQK